jgi:hypothetical protein
MQIDVKKQGDKFSHSGWGLLIIKLFYFDVNFI